MTIHHYSMSDIAGTEMWILPVYYCTETQVNHWLVILLNDILMGTDDEAQQIDLVDRVPGGVTENGIIYSLH